MTTPCSGAISIANLNAEFGAGNDLNSYHGIAGAPASGAISLAHLYCKSNFNPPGTLYILAGNTGQVLNFGPGGSYYFYHWSSHQEMVFDYNFTPWQGRPAVTLSFGTASSIIFSFYMTWDGTEYVSAYNTGYNVNGADRVWVS